MLANVTDTEPLARSAVIRTMAEHGGRVEIADPSAARGDPLCAHHAGGLITRDQSIHLASQLRALCDQAVGVDAALTFAAVGTGGRRALLGGDSSLRGLRDLGAGAGLRGRTPREGSRLGRGGALEDTMSVHGPRVLDRALERASGGLMEVLNQGSGVELWCENRCA